MGIISRDYVLPHNDTSVEPITFTYNKAPPRADDAESVETGEPR